MLGRGDGFLQGRSEQLGVQVKSALGLRFLFLNRDAVGKIGNWRESTTNSCGVVRAEIRRSTETRLYRRRVAKGRVSELPGWLGGTVSQSGCGLRVIDQNGGHRAFKDP